MATEHILQLKAMLDTSQVKQQIQQLNSQGTVNLDASGITQSLNRLNDIIGKFTGSLDKLQKNTEKQAQQTEINAGRLMKFAAGLATHQLAGSIQKYAEATGNTSVAYGVGALGKIGSAAAMGAAAGGPIGAGIGVAVAGLNEVFNLLAENAKKSAEEMEKYAAAMAAARQKDEEFSRREETRRLQTILDRGSKENLIYEYGWAIKDVEKYRGQIESFKSKYGNLQSAEITPEERERKERELRALNTTTITMQSSAGAFTRTSTNEKAVEEGLAKWEAERKKEAEAYIKAQDEYDKALNAASKLENAINQRNKAEQQAADAATKKAEADKKAAAEAEKQIANLKKLDADYDENQGIKAILKQSDPGLIQESLARYQNMTEAARSKYLEDLAGGDPTKAKESRDEWMRMQSIVDSLQSAGESLRQKSIADKESKLNDAMTELQKARQGDDSVAGSFGAMGGGMGWTVDENFESQMTNSVKSIEQNIREILGQLRNMTNNDQSNVILF